MSHGKDVFSMIIEVGLRLWLKLHQNSSQHGILARLCSSPRLFKLGLDTRLLIITNICYHLPRTCNLLIIVQLRTHEHISYAIMKSTTAKKILFGKLCCYAIFLGRKLVLIHSLSAFSSKMWIVSCMCCIYYYYNYSKYPPLLNTKHN